MNYGKLIAVHLTFFWIQIADGCAVQCDKLTDYLCAGEHLITPGFMSRLETLTHLLFSICHYDADDRKTYKLVHEDSSLKNSNFRPSIGITLAECNNSINFDEASNTNQQIWNNPDCQLDNFLLLLVQNDTIFPQLITKRHPFHDFELKTSYNLSSLEELAEISLLKMEEINRSHQTESNDDFIEPSQDIKSHWPTWALIVVVVCIILSLLAFFLGNYITKKATPIRNKGQPANTGKVRERKWGAGFSGGLWAAA